jgi:Protein involved in formate dehydrogenase formation
MTTKTAGTVDPIVQSLRRLSQESPYLKDAALLYEAILPLLRDAHIPVEPVSLTRDQAFSKMETGLPLLHNLNLELDIQSVHDLMLQLALAVETFGEKKQQSYRREMPRWCSDKPCAANAGQVRLALEENRLNISELLPSMAAGERNSVTSAAQGLGLDIDLLWTVMQNALKPALRAWCRQLTPLTEEIPWYRGSCFICGADPALGELRGNTQSKYLRCGLCGADWSFRRLQCMYCGNEDHAALGYLYPENQKEKLRVEVCEKCKGYLKVITTFSPTPPEMLPVEDLATLHLDYIAQERGYARLAVQRARI